MSTCCCFASCTRLFKKYFVDLRVMAALMCVWLLVVLVILFELGVFARSKFVAFGPRDDLTFMHVRIDTYHKYNMLIAMIICHTFITDLIADSLVPHVLNVVQDTKNRYIPHRSRTYLLITSAWSVYCSVTQLFVIFIAFGQLDLLLVRLASDLFANFFTLNMYLDGKVYDPDLHAKNSAPSERRIFTIESEEEEPQEIMYSRKKPVALVKTKTDTAVAEETVELIFETAEGAKASDGEKARLLSE
jgi:hypothetical protein